MWILVSQLQGSVEHGKGNLYEAGKLYAKAIRLDPEVFDLLLESWSYSQYVEAHYNNGVLAQDLGKSNLAYSRLKKALSIADLVIYLRTFFNPKLIWLGCLLEIKDSSCNGNGEAWQRSAALCARQLFACTSAWTWQQFGKLLLISSLLLFLVSWRAHSRLYIIFLFFTKKQIS